MLRQNGFIYLIRIDVNLFNLMQKYDFLHLKGEMIYAMVEMIYFSGLARNK